jgi:hypothetical protein
MLVGLGMLNNIYNHTEFLRPDSFVIHSDVIMQYQPFDATSILKDGLQNR